MWPPDMVRCINAFVEFHIFYSFPHNPQYQHSLFPFSPLLSTLSHHQIERITALIWWSSSLVILDMVVRSSFSQLMDPVTQEDGSISSINPGINGCPWDTHQWSIPRWEIGLTFDVGTTVGLIGKHKQNRKQMWVYQQDDTVCNTTIPLTLINK